MYIPTKPKKQGLYSPEFEHDACGVGFIANIKGIQSHKVVSDGLQILENLEHRGACGCDPKTGDGAGILTQVPDSFLRAITAEQRINLPKVGDYGTGIVFLPQRADQKNTIEEWFEEIIREEGQTFLGWREVPHDSEQIGEVAHSVEPEFRQIFIAKGDDVADELAFERKLYVIRKRIENKVAQAHLSEKDFFYICSLSTRTIVYKGQLMSTQVGPFFNDLADERFVSAIALVHSRYSTNTFPTWSLAHPYRMLAHNGEINTLRGNINWMRARESQLISDAFGDDIHKIFPVCTPDASDSAILDNVFELLTLSGRTLPHVAMMMIPEAWNGDDLMDPTKKAFYEYHSCLMEPWDGPASVAFSDGRFIGAVLDRNGLRPSRWVLTKDDFVIMGSEAGVLEVTPENIKTNGRLRPGKMFLIDTVNAKIIDDDELKRVFSSRKPYAEWIKENVVDLESMSKPHHIHGLDAETIQTRQLAFGWTLENLGFILKPMVIDGVEATGSMGHDTPLAVFSHHAQPLYHYFKQLFAQVTNPPVDAIREELVMSSHMMLGAEQNLFDETAKHCQRLRVKHPILTNESLEKIRSLDQEGLKAETLDMIFDIKTGAKGLDPAIDALYIKADQAIDAGATLLVLSDRAANADHAAMPSLLACAGLHHHLIRNGRRTRVSLIVETGEAREMHHFATLMGYGVNAINPYLIFESIEHEITNHNYPEGLTFEKACTNFIKATRKGLFKVLSKMGISTLQSYCGGQIFEAVGLGDKLIDKYFTATPSRIGGIGVEDVAEEVLTRHERAYPTTQGGYDGLPPGGDYAWRRDGEHHMLNPQSIALLQHSVRSGDYKIFKQFSKSVNDIAKQTSTIRGLMEFKTGQPIPIEEVEPASEIVKRFATGAMSYGSISKEMHETLAIAMNRLGGFSNTGEGGENRERYKPMSNGDSKRSRIKQVAQGRFGVTIEYLVNADQLQIKMAQGAKPGEGGQLPGHKVSKEIAQTRGTTPGVGLISPPPHHDIYSIEDLAQLIYDLKNANRKADVSVKLVSEIGVGTVAAGVAKGKADHVLISGFEGGTGASPQTSIRHAGLPMELGIAEAQQTLVMNDLRGRIRVQTDGQLRTGRDVVIAGMLGADEFGFATIALVTSGCILLRKCHLNTCSVGIATQDKELRKQFTGKPEHIVNYFMFVAEEVREVMAELGFRNFNELIGRVDLLEKRKVITHWKSKGVDLSKILHKPDVPAHVSRYHTGTQDHGLEDVLDMELLDQCKDAIENKTPVKHTMNIRNIHRTAGTILSSEIARKYGIEGLPDDTIQIKFNGSAGQSFGAFLSKGVSFELEGEVNDYVGKGISGGKIIVYPPKKSTIVAEKNIIAGNVLFYGATSGEGYIRGLGGERFCVRNSGVKTVIEGIGDHGCEYMTAGIVVVLGPTGKNFAAGMSGGIAYIWNPDGKFEERCNPEMVDLVPVDEAEDQKTLKTLIESHLKHTDSAVAKKLLDNWSATIKQFTKVYPRDYRRVLEEAALAQKDEVKEVVHG
ncbi:MAG: glutamate synthase domain-containing protein 2/glutamate synthase domain-containing protein 1 [Candidatus Omnitrophota bacterium]|jgi:glutamate synthase domain-containing protein 2/glutamate synthase domain-containing protein 1/glutamate synthase domain-containing protein 3